MKNRITIFHFILPYKQTGPIERQTDKMLEPFLIRSEYFHIEDNYAARKGNARESKSTNEPLTNSLEFVLCVTN